MVGSVQPQPGVFADEIIAPLLSKEDGGTVATSVNSDEQEDGPSANNGMGTKPSAAQAFKSVMVVLLAVGGAAASVASFIVMPATMVYIAGGICIMNLPIVVCKERKILFLPS